ncbi:DUF2489 domain-containing protein [Teredinibacter sp. KSP-S5-2]|uniref:DUF2489 domain-containing protein n=1 Tax=Teredinibacter sp. KSP-S5-2 TaxID=3034506 RepID=UPI0029344B7F|nr:DUF2489 domain-containing protein [Teredinibacter sp. KSP-S5-2]WNO10916.1 DUF2489 domain-containing protein [Teredinibacter sp. KSP-S5-2]
MTSLLIGIAVVVVLVLFAVALYLHWLLYKQRLKHDEGVRVLEALQKEKRMRTKKSITVLAKGTLEGQVTLTEACIRISKLMESINFIEDNDEDYKVFSQLAQATSHIPILDEWQKLTKKEKQVYEKQREKIEEKYQDFVENAMHRLLKDERLNVEE